MFSSWNTTLPQAATTAIEAGDPEAAISLYENAISSGASDPAALGNLGVLLWRLFEFRRAETVFAQMMDDARTDSATLQRVAHCYFEVGRFEKSAAAMRVALSRLATPDAATTNTLAWTLERNHEIDEARHFAEAANQLDASYAPAVRLLGHLDSRAGNLDAAARRLRDQLQGYPGESDWALRYELAAVADKLGHYDEAWSALCQAKVQLATQTAEHLRLSYFIRQRQWELAQSVTAADLRRWRQAGSALVPSHRIAFLTGFPRSGTTLLEQIIAANDDTIGTDESGILARQFVEPLIWRANDAMDVIIELRSFDTDQLVAGREMYWRLTESYLDEPVAGRLLIEKNPLQTADIPLPLRLFPESRWLIALRDPRDVVLSYLFTMVPLNWMSAPATSVVEACQFYADTMRHWLWWRGRLDLPTLETSYERLISDPQHETQHVAKFLGLQWNATMLDERQRSERKAVRTPTYVDVTKPLYSRAVGRWHNYRDHLKPGLKILEPFVKAFGYDSSS